MDLERAIRERAAALGFSACGFSAAVPLERGAFLDGWLDGGFAGEMRYLARRPERRLTVGGILPDARTVVSLAYPYAPPPPPPVDWRRELRGRIAAYALGEDYHRTLDRKLAAIADSIAAMRPGSRTRRYVDTGAVLEREWAVRGGLGWFGKNTMLLGTRAGSWFFLGELVTTVALAPDTPEGEHCGSCTRCQVECPTAALRDGLTIDAPRCISYLTIEHRGAIPRPLRAAIGPWVFGCDVCQEVCPWNGADAAARRSGLERSTPWLAPNAAAARRGSRVPETAIDEATGGRPADERWRRDHRAAPRAGEPSRWLFPPLAELVTLDERGFRARFARTPLLRAKRRGLVRNAAVALGNTGNPAATRPLAAALADAEPLVRGHAAWALGALGTPDARRVLDARRPHEREPFARGEIDAALAGAG